jgi:hypothetical protein
LQGLFWVRSWILYPIAFLTKALLSASEIMIAHKKSGQEAAGSSVLSKMDPLPEALFCNLGNDFDMLQKTCILYAFCCNTGSCLALFVRILRGMCVLWNWIALTCVCWMRCNMMGP